MNYDELELKGWDNGKVVLHGSGKQFLGLEAVSGFEAKGSHAETVIVAHGVDTVFPEGDALVTLQIAPLSCGFGDTTLEDSCEMVVLLGRGEVGSGPFFSGKFFIEAQGRPVVVVVLLNEVQVQGSILRELVGVCGSGIGLVLLVLAGEHLVSLGDSVVDAVGERPDLLFFALLLSLDVLGDVSLVESVLGLDKGTRLLKGVRVLGVSLVDLSLDLGEEFGGDGSKVFRASFCSGLKFFLLLVELSKVSLVVVIDGVSG